MASPEPNPGYRERWFFFSQPKSNDKQPLCHPHSGSFTPVRKSNSAEHQLRPVLCALWLVPKLNTYVNPMPLLSGLNTDQDTQRFWSFPSVYHCQVGISQAACPPPTETGCNHSPPPRQPNVTSKELRDGHLSLPRQCLCNVGRRGTSQEKSIPSIQPKAPTS